MLSGEFFFLEKLWENRDCWPDFWGTSSAVHHGPRSSGVPIPHQPTCLSPTGRFRHVPFDVAYFKACYTIGCFWNKSQKRSCWTISRNHWEGRRRGRRKTGNLIHEDQQVNQVFLRLKHTNTLLFKEWREQRAVDRWRSPQTIPTLKLC